MGRIRSAVQRLIRQGPDNGPLQPFISEFWSELRGFGLPHRVAENVGAASRALQLTSQNVGALTPIVEGGSRRPMWIDDPDPGWFNGFNEVLQAAVYQYYRFGDAFLYITSRYADTDAAQAFTVLDSVTMDVKERNGNRTYRANGYPLIDRNVVQISRTPPVYPAVRSKGALEAYWANMSSAVASDSFASGVFSGLGVPQAVLSVDRQLTNKKAEELQAEWMSSVARRYGAPAVLPRGVEFKQLAWSPKELMLLELRAFDVRAICAALGVPAMLLNVPIEGGLTYQNPTALFDFWWRSELRTTAHRFERAMSARLMPRRQSFRLDPGTLLLPPFVEYAAAMAKGYEHQAVTLDEYRVSGLRLPPLPDGAGVEMRPDPVVPELAPGAETDDNAEADDVPPRLRAMATGSDGS